MSSSSHWHGVFARTPHTIRRTGSCHVFAPLLCFSYSIVAQWLRQTTALASACQATRTVPMTLGLLHCQTARLAGTHYEYTFRCCSLLLSRSVAVLLWSSAAWREGT